ncbi:hypothetical protein ACFPRL_20415 [Pseudoclavibacter helvolus]
MPRPKSLWAAPEIIVARSTVRRSRAKELETSSAPSRRESSAPRN